MRKEEPNTSDTSCKHSTIACATDLTHATKRLSAPCRSAPLRTHTSCVFQTWKLKGYAVGAWGNLCKAGLPSGRQNAAHDQITERNVSVP